MGHLTRMMRHIARKHRFLASRADQNAQMPGAMAGRRKDAYFLADAVAWLNEIDATGVDDGFYRIVEHGREMRVVATVSPVVVFRASEQVARFREGRHPSPVHEPRVPA